MRHATLVRLVLPFGVLFSLGCPGDTAAPPTPAIAITTSASAVTMNQGASQNITVTVNRTNFTSPVTLTIEGLPAGVTGAFSPASVPDGTTTSTLALSSTSTATPGTATLTIRAAGTGVTEQIATIALTVNVTGTYSLAVSPTSVALVQGASGSATVNIVRSNGFAGAVALAVTGAPSGLTATLNPTSATGNSSSLTLAASSSSTVGTHTLTITGTTAGLANQTATLSVQISAPPSTTSLTINLCIDQPLWVAIQNEGESWKRIQPTSGTTYTFEATSKFGFAEVVPDNDPNGGFRTFILYSTVAELQPYTNAACLPERGSRSLTVPVAGLNSQSAAINMLFQTSQTTSAPVTFTSLPDHALDAIGVRSASGVPDRVIVRRNITQASGSMPTFDFAASEAVAPVQHTLTVTGAESGESVFAGVQLHTERNTRGLISGSSLSGSTGTFHSVASSQRMATDMHRMEVSAGRSTSTGGSARGAFYFFKDGSNKSTTLGAALATPTFTVSATTPYVRMRGQMPSQADYNTEMQFFWGQNTARREVSIQATAAYYGGMPATWDLTVPDFSAVAGFNNDWMLKTGETTLWHAWASNSKVLAELSPVDGDSFRFAERFDNSSLQPAIVGSHARLTRPRRAVTTLFGRDR